MKLQYKSELRHFGIKGMHWGIRRFQNKDGTLTEAGKKRVKRQGSDNLDGKVPAAQEDLQRELGRSDHVIPKGTSVYRFADPGEKLTNRRVFASVLSSDRGQYRGLVWEPGMLGNNLAEHRPSEYKYKTKTDLLVVSPKQQYDYIYEKFGNTTINDLYAKRTVEQSYYSKREAEALNEFIRKYGNTKMSALKGDMNFLYENDNEFRTGYGYSYGVNSSKERKRVGEYANTMYNIDRRFFESTIQWKSKEEEAKDKYLNPKHYEMQEHFKKLGYQALVDLEDWGVVAEYPLIIMDPKANLKKVKETKL